MGLTHKSTGTNALGKKLSVELNSSDKKVIALAGNPNVGKSTIFNNLTGLKQHTGNWPGKTVTNATGKYIYREEEFMVVDIPGTYSLMANSVEEEVARDFICFGKIDAIVVIVDGTCLERNLNLVLQTIEITKKVIVCVNLMDEARRKGITIDLKKLSNLLGVKVVGTSATIGKGIEELMKEVYDIAVNNINQTPIDIKYNNSIEEAILLIKNKVNNKWISLKLLEGDKSLLESISNYKNIDLNSEELKFAIAKGREIISNSGFNKETFKDEIVSTLITIAENIRKEVVFYSIEKYNARDRKVDRILTSKSFGIPIMILLLGVIFWLTIIGANYPSEILSKVLFYIQNRLTDFFLWLGAPAWVEGVLVQGMYKTLAWVVSVMLPPMAIFFPLFTFLEDLGYLPRIAFNLDNFFRKCQACGKQALTMCMGFGCNASGIVGCRIIDSPRERLIAIITNNFVPCNGRFPTLIAVITMFFAGFFLGPIKSIVSTIILLVVIMLGIIMTFIISRILSKTILKGIPSSFTLELPPYRKPQLGKIIIRSIMDRTLFVLGRAVLVAAPTGIVIWIMANIKIGNISVLSHCAEFLNPFANLIGLDGYILMAFILGFPANEIVIPIIIMSYMATGSLVEIDSMRELHKLLVSNGWTWLTAVCVMLFSLMHWPCSTTCLTIKKETQSLKWTIISFLVPTITGIIICFIFTTIVRFLGIV